MATNTTSTKTVCYICKKQKRTIQCPGCAKQFCFDDIPQHRRELSEAFSQTEDGYNQLQCESAELLFIRLDQHQITKDIDRWEQQSIETIQRHAQQMREDFLSHYKQFSTNFHSQFEHIIEKLRTCRADNDFIESDIDDFNEELKRLKKLASDRPKIEVELLPTSFLEQINLRFSKPLLRSAHLQPNSRWIQQGPIVAGAERQGKEHHYLHFPLGICVHDDDQNRTIYIADQANHRIAEWKKGATQGLVINGVQHDDQFRCPTDVVVDRINNDLIIADRGNRRVVRWSRTEGTSRGRAIITDIGCYGLAFNEEDQSLYVVDRDRHEVRRYRSGDTIGVVVAGGHDQGNGLHQLSDPHYVFVDRFHSVYVSDTGN